MLLLRRYDGSVAVTFSIRGKSFRGDTSSRSYVLAALLRVFGCLLVNLPAILFVVLCRLPAHQ
jgi:hypothetical protein